MEDKELKKKLKRIPDADADGDPIYKIDAGGRGRKKNKPAKKSSR